MKNKEKKIALSDNLKGLIKLGKFYNTVSNFSNAKRFV